MIVCPATTGNHPLRLNLSHQPDRIIRSMRARSMIARYFELLTWPSRSRSLGVTRNGVTAVSRATSVLGGRDRGPKKIRRRYRAVGSGLTSDVTAAGS